MEDLECYNSYFWVFLDVFGFHVLVAYGDTVVNWSIPDFTKGLFILSGKKKEMIEFTVVANVVSF